MEFYDPQTIRNADIKAMSELGVPGIVLMENAGRNSVDVLMKSFQVSAVCVLVGSGNNGGDGLVMARHLVMRNIRVTVISSIPLSSFKGESSVNLEVIRSLGVAIYESSQMTDQDILDNMVSGEICVDALLGTGSKGSPRGECSRIISLLPSSVPTISIDIPSGTDPLTGQVYSPCVSAELTITMLAPKTGLATMPASMHAGKIKVVDIGIPPEKVIEGPPRLRSVTEEEVRTFIPDRPVYLHKGGRGNVSVIGSSPEYRGAVALTALGCLRTGSGLVFTVSSLEGQNVTAQFLPESITWGFPFDDQDVMDDVKERIGFIYKKSDSMIIGPGLGRTALALRIVEEIWNEVTEIPLILDADALFLLSENHERFLRRENVILTPHEGEAARLLGTDVGHVRNNRLKCVRELAERWGTVLLKGPCTLIDDVKRTAVVLEGNPSLAVPGSGDVLSGIIGSIAAGGVDLFHAASMGAWIHASAGDELTGLYGMDGVLAREIANRVPAVMNSLRNV